MHVIYFKILNAFKEIKKTLMHPKIYFVFNQIKSIQEAIKPKGTDQGNKKLQFSSGCNFEITSYWDMALELLKNFINLSFYQNFKLLKFLSSFKTMS